MSDWSNVKNLLVIRPDNMGDLIMSGPALRSLKKGLGTRITVLTSSMATPIAGFMPEIDEVITFDLPWVKINYEHGAQALNDLIVLLRKKQFDAAVVFTVYSQNPLPSAMIAYQAGIPKMLSYCRENPYGLISDWVADEEPFAYISHQVDRDLRLISHVCSIDPDVKLRLQVNKKLWPAIAQKLNELNINLNKPWLILHAGVSEIKRQLPEEIWIKAAKQLTEKGYQVLLTGGKDERELAGRLQQGTGERSFNVAGLFSIGEMTTLISYAPLLLSVNTGVVHIAAAVNTPVVVLYAQTNPQHTPWQVSHVVIEFPVPAKLKSKNEIIRQVDETLYAQPASMPDASAIVEAALTLLRPPAVSDQPSHEIPNENRAISAS